MDFSQHTPLNFMYIINSIDRYVHLSLAFLLFSTTIDHLPPLTINLIITWQQSDVERYADFRKKCIQTAYGHSRTKLIDVLFAEVQNIWVGSENFKALIIVEHLFTHWLHTLQLDGYTGTKVRGVYAKFKRPPTAECP